MASGSSMSLDVYGTPAVRESVSNWIVAELENCLPAAASEPSPRMQKRLKDLGSHIERLAGDGETDQTLAEYFRQIEVHLKTIRNAGIVEKLVRKEEETALDKQHDEGVGAEPSTGASHRDEQKEYSQTSGEFSSSPGRGKMKDEDLNYK